MYTVEKSAKTIEEAIRLALHELGVEEDETKVEVLSVPSKGFLGIGNKNAVVRVTTLAYLEEQEMVAKAKERALKAAEEEALKNRKIEVKKEINTELEKEGKKEIQAELKKEVKETIVESIKIDNADLEIYKQKAYDFLRGVLDNMDIKAEIKISFEENRMNVELAGPNMGIIIGRHGQTLDAIQYLTNLFVNKDNSRDNFMKVALDTEGYRSKREELLVAMAKKMAEKVIATGRSVKLEPMNPYERRIVHASLQGVAGIATFSEDQEPYRHIVISKK